MKVKDDFSDFGHVIVVAGLSVSKTNTFLKKTNHFQVKTSLSKV